VGVHPDSHTAGDTQDLVVAAQAAMDEAAARFAPSKIWRARSVQRRRYGDAQHGGFDSATTAPAFAADAVEAGTEV